MTKISDLSDGGTLQSTDELIVVRSGGNARAKMNTLPDMTVSQSPSVPSSSAQIFYNSTKGAVLRGQGSTSDVTLENDAGQTALKVPTGTQRVDLTSLTVTNDVAVGSVTANANLDVTGSTGIYQRHSSGGSIVLDDSDTADASSPMVYVRNTSGQLRFGGANRNGTTKQTTGSVDYVTIDSANTVFNSGSADSDFTVRSDNNTHALVVNGGNSAVSIGGTGSDKRLNVYHSANATTGVHVENLTSGASARASLALRSDGGFLYFFATSQSYTGVASWQDAAVIANSSSLAGGIVVNSQAGGITLQDSTVSRLEIVPNSELVINQSGIDRDFRVESNTSTHALYVDAGNGRVGINNAAPAQALDVGGNVNCVGMYSQSLYVTAQGGAGVTQGDIRISSATTESPGSRGQGVFVFNHGTDTTWYTGTVYGAGDRYQVGFASGTSLNVDAARSSGGVFNLYTGASGAVFNQQGANRDFRVESNSQTHMIFVDGDNDFVGFNAATATANSGASFSAYTGGIKLNVSHNGSAASGDAYVSFLRTGTTIGSITQVSSTGVAYNTSSDARLKENIVDADAAGKLLDQIKVRQFDWRETGEHQRFGMIAQELAEVIPEVVSVPIDPDDMQGIDYSKLMPLVIKEIQELRTRVTQLTRS